MQIFPARLAVLSGVTALVVFYSTAIAAEPVAGLPELNHVGEQMLASQEQTAADLIARIPSREMVGIAVYPGALYTGEIEGTGILPSVVLASAEPIEKVKAWYDNQPGFTYEETLNLFYLGDEYVMMETESVFLQDISENPQASAGALMFNMADMKTQMTISFKPKEGTDHE